MMSALRNQLSSSNRRFTSMLGLSDNGNNSTLQNRIYTYFKNRLGQYFQVFIFSSLLLVLFLIALRAQSLEIIAEHLPTPQIHPQIVVMYPSSLNETMLINNGTDASISHHHHHNSKSTPTQDAFHWVMVGMSFWYLSRMISNARLYRMQTSGGGQAQGLRMLVSMMNQRGGADRLRMAMLERDFTGEDYEMLQRLDSDGSPRAPRGVSDVELSTLPVQKLRTGDPLLSQQQSNGTDDIDCEAGQSTCIEDAQCNICLGPYEVGDEVRGLPCLHKYHRQCIDPWLRSHTTCPVCKASVLGE